MTATRLVDTPGAPSAGDDVTVLVGTSAGPTDSHDPLEAADALRPGTSLGSGLDLSR